MLFFQNKLLVLGVRGEEVAVKASYLQRIHRPKSSMRPFFLSQLIVVHEGAKNKKT